MLGKKCQIRNSINAPSVTNQSARTLTRAVGVSVKPWVKRSETPGPSAQKICRAREAADRVGDDQDIIRNRFTVLPASCSCVLLLFPLSAAPRALVIFRAGFLGFRCASPQALRLRPLRGLFPVGTALVLQIRNSNSEFRNSNSS